MTIKPSKDGNSILFAYRYHDGNLHDEAYGQVNKQELIDKGDEPEIYANEYSEQAEILGYLVSNAKLTQDNIYGLMVEVVFGAS